MQLDLFIDVRIVSLLSGMGNWRWRGTSLNMPLAALIARIMLEGLLYILLVCKLFDKKRESQVLCCRNP